MSGIKALIFDFGDVFINLDKEGALANALNLFNIEEFDKEMVATNMAYETGLISTESFLRFYSEKYNYLSREDIITAWNYILKDFPPYRLEFLKSLKSNGHFKLILLSNTNQLHIDSVKATVPFYEDFKNCFDAFYLSHEIKMRKPTRAIFEYVLQENKLNAEQCLFIDDTKENTEAALKLGIHTWNIDEKTEDIINLFDIKKDLF